jgi:hypothetical protein
MQRSLRANAHRLAYFRDDQYRGDDALDISIKGLAFGLPSERLAASRRRRGLEGMPATIEH